MEVDGQVLGSGFTAVSGRDWTKQFTMTRLAHCHSPTTVQDKSLKQSFVHFCLFLGDSGAISMFRAGRREEFVGMSSRL